MRKFAILFSAIVLCASALEAQSVATFETLSLATTDTFYANYTASGSDVGFNDGLAHFPCVYDTSFGGYWSSGFAYSNKRDSVHSGYTNQYSAKTAGGYGGSTKYAVAYGTENKVMLRGAAIGKPVNGFYVTNNTYAYNSMRDGDFVAKKFGGTTGNDPDWYKLVVRAYLHDTLKSDSVSFYLADYRFAHNDSDYIVNTWKWVNLAPLGNADSLQFNLSSSDNGSFGINTPTYFCIDNFITHETAGLPNAVTDEHPAGVLAKLYPNPARDIVYADLSEATVSQVNIADVAGRVVAVYPICTLHVEMNISQLPAGTYTIQFIGTGKTGAAKFVKQ